MGLIETPTSSANRIAVGVIVCGLMAAAGLALALLPRAEAALGFAPLNDKICHFAFFSAFYCLLRVLVLEFWAAGSVATGLGATGLGAAGLGAAIEGLQFVSPFARKPDIADFGINLLGIATAALLVALLRFMWRRVQDRRGAQTV